jgi:MOSC domain-containing protein YiiM
MNENSPLQALLNSLPQRGQVKWIGLRPARGVSMVEPARAELLAGSGLVGDRFNGRTDGPRQVSLIQYEHLAVIAACVGHGELAPALLRRNIAISGINLLALKDKRFRVGTALLEYSGLCHPCSKMETALGAGGYNALRGHGGITARVLESGSVGLGDTLYFCNEGA